MTMKVSIATGTV